MLVAMMMGGCGATYTPETWPDAVESANCDWALRCAADGSALTMDSCMAGLDANPWPSTWCATIDDGAAARCLRETDAATCDTTAAVAWAGDCDPETVCASGFSGEIR